MCENTDSIPKKIWMLWFQGTDDMPFIVKKCVDSWITKNPTWEVIVLDNSNLKDFIKLDIPDETLKDVSLALQSDLIRVELLSRYGGVWADATTYCMIPLDNWLESSASSGFFVFHKPGRDRLISSWFIASIQNHPICTKLFERLKLFLVTNKFNKPNKIQRKLTAYLSRFFNRNTKTTNYWFNPVVTKILKVYPYFVFHYMFARLVWQDKECKELWNKCTPMSADLPHLIQRQGFFSEPVDEIKRKVTESQIPVFKLTWKYDHSKYSKGTLLHYLLESEQP